MPIDVRAGITGRLLVAFEGWQPEKYLAIQTSWRRFRTRCFERRLARVNASIVKWNGLRVRSGPFQGMQYVERAMSSTLGPKLLGSYEAELTPHLNRFLASAYTTVADIGCAEGYYAVGLAMRLPNARIYAYDIDPNARQLCLEMASANAVSDRVIVSGGCDADALSKLPLGGALMICDCEGAELDLLQPLQVPHLRDCDILVELHDFLDPQITSTIVSRFRDTHEIEIVASKSRDPEEYLESGVLNLSDAKLAVDELRRPMSWAIMKSRGITRH